MKAPGLVCFWIVGVASISSGSYRLFISSSEPELLLEASLVMAVVEPRDRGRKADRSDHIGTLARGESRFIEETVDCRLEGIFMVLCESFGEESGVD